MAAAPRILRYSITTLLIAVVGNPDVQLCRLNAAAPQSSAAPTVNVEPQRALLNKYCVSCHSEKLRTAGLSLEKIDVVDVAGGAPVWEKVLRKVNAGVMPPVGMPRPDSATFGNFTNWIETALDRAAAAKPNPGRVAVHRLNNIEYANAIRDMLALEINVRSLLGLDDAGENGFDNMASALTMSPALVERYVSAARTISRQAVGDPAVLPVFEMYDVPKLLMQDERTSEDLPFGSRGGIAVHHHFPVDGEYQVKIKLRGQEYDYIIGMGRAHQIEVRLDGKRVKLFTVGGEAPGKPAPLSHAGQIPGDPAWEEYMHFADKNLEVRFPARAGTRVVGVSFVEDVVEPEGVAQPRQTGGTGIQYNEQYNGYAAVETLSIGGPFKVEGSGDTPSRRSIFVCRPARNSEEEACAKKIIANLARRAYRRPVTDGDIQPLLHFYETARKQGSFESGIQTALQRVLTDPEFLFRFEPDPPNKTPGTPYRLNDVALASRLSFFLWSSIPDTELLDLAAAGKLHTPEVLSKQVRRMFADSRAKALAQGFATQWLELPKLRGVAPDPDEYPDFDENLRAAFQRETELFLTSQLGADRSVVDLVGANYTFVNERLARHYGIPNIYGEAFRRVTFDNGERGGLLGQGSVLTVTSYANRTSPVLRGKWMLDNLLALPPPPPPPNVPALTETPQNGKLASIRERMEQHRKNPACAVCHVKMDPLGFALENFDAIGQWHSTTKDGTPVDVDGAFPDGTKLRGVAGLRQAMLSRRQQFVGAFTEKLLAWALGRGIDYYDLPAVRKIVREAAASDYRWSAIIEGVVKSVPFQMSSVRAPESQLAGTESAPATAVASVVKGKDVPIRRSSK